MIPNNVRQREYAGGSIGGAGILRKNNVASSSTNNPSSAEARQIDLLVFGYACKVFRDDEKAREIDQGKHLIPWMGDSSLKIDRYDVRGALSDLAPHEPPPGGYSNRLDYLSADEQRAEQLCEEERYLFLYNNEEEFNLQHEEELKRLKHETSSLTYNEVGFQYDSEASGSGIGVQHGPEQDRSNSPASDDIEKPFTLPKNFIVPPSIKLPETMKQHAIIEKTARFIANQGIQMEILLKAKQSNNVQFEFLSQDSILNPYYKFMINAIKSDTYPTEPTYSDTGKQIDDGTVDAAEDAAILQSTTTESIAKPIITVPQIKYKPSASCAYTQLISKIKGVPLPVDFDENATTNSLSNSPTPTGNSTSEFTSILAQYNGSTLITADNDCSTSSLNSENQKANEINTEVKILKNSSALALAQNYSSGSDNDDDDDNDDNNSGSKPKIEEKPETPLRIPVPTDNLKNIIDKTAIYVIKNGRQFEETLRTKDEERFIFLVPGNEFYPYYMYKITGDQDAASKEEKTRKAAAVAAAVLSKKGITTSKTVSPVSFCIKSKDEPPIITLQPVLPQETSDDESESNIAKQQQSVQNNLRTVPEEVRRAVELVESQLIARNAQLTGSTPIYTQQSITVHNHLDVNYNHGSNVSTINTNAKSQIKSTKAELARNAIFEQQQQSRQKELKKAEEKVKDKLALIAREKLGGLITKEKQLQLERKRKAMAFLNQIKAPANSESEPSIKPKKIKTNNEDDPNASDESEGSVHSIPITSYGPEGKTDDEEEEAAVACIRTANDIPSQTAHIPVQRTFEDIKSKKNTTIVLSDDDEVQIIDEIKATVTKLPHKKKKAHKRRSRSHTRKKKSSTKRKRANSSSSILSTDSRSMSVSSASSPVLSSASSSASSSTASRSSRMSSSSSSTMNRHKKSSSHSSKHLAKAHSHKSAKAKKKSKSSKSHKSSSKKKSKKKKHARSRTPVEQSSGYKKYASRSPSVHLVQSHTGDYYMEKEQHRKYSPHGSVKKKSKKNKYY